MASQPALADLAVAQVQALDLAQVQIHQACRALDSYVNTAIVGRMVIVAQALAVAQTLAVDSHHMLDLNLGMGLMKHTLAVDQPQAVNQTLAVVLHHILDLNLGMGMGLMKQTLAVDQAQAHRPLADVWLLTIVNLLATAMRKKTAGVLIAHFQSGCAMASQPALADLAVAQVQALDLAQVQIHQACDALDSYVKTAIVDRMVIVDQALAVDQTLAVDSHHILALNLGMGLCFMK
jgi:hypothetical protein